MKTHLQSVCIVTGAIVLGLSLAAGGQELPAPETVVPAGDYQVAWLTLAKGWEGGQDLRLFLGIRGGKATAVWFCAPQRRDCHYMWPDAIGVAIAGDKLTGEISGRMVKVWAPIAEVGDYVYRLDAALGEGKIAGTYTARFALKGQAEQKAGGEVTGTVAAREQLDTAQRLPAGKDWPGYYGVGSAFRGPDCGARMIDDLKDARPMWKAEEPLPCMWGKGPEDRYVSRACMVGCAGGASSPAVAGGRVYLFYFRPSGKLGAAPIGYAPAAPKFATEAEITAFAAKHSANPIAQRALVDWYRPFADDIVVCLDAATGRTLWKAVLKDRSANMQGHKWRGYNPVPFVSGGVVYVANYANRLYALDAGTGKLLWEYGDLVGDRGKGRAFGPGSTQPVVAGGVVVVSARSTGATAGVDAKTGKQLWKQRGSGNLLIWRTGQAERVVTCGGHGKMLVSCLDPKTGQALWKAEAPLWGAGNILPVLDGDCLVGFEDKRAPDEIRSRTDFALDCQVLCYRLQADGMDKAWAVPAPQPATDCYGLTVSNGHVYIDGREDTFCLKLDTGEKVGSAKAGGARTQVAFAADGRVFIQPEGRHGGQSFYMLDGDPKAFRRLGELWVPPHPHDTAYACQAVMYPVVDGRLFVRGHDGLYCYDLRKPAR